MIILRPQQPSSRPEEGDPGDGDDALVDRTAAMAELTLRVLAIGRLVRLWLIGGVAVVGWAALGLAVRGFEEDGFGDLFALAALALAVFFLVPAAFATGFWIRRGRDVHRMLDAWADLGDELVTDDRLRAQGRCVSWLLTSALLSVLGGWAAVRAGARVEPVTVGGLVYALGLGVTVLVTGLLGLGQAWGHQRWAERLLSAVPVRRGGGAHR